MVDAASLPFFYTEASTSITVILGREQLQN